MFEPKRLTPVYVKITTKRPAVFSYQTALQKLGYYEAAIDGIYGRRSATAVMNFQDSFNGSSDGVIGLETATELLKQSGQCDWQPGLKRRIMEAIAFYELSISRNAFGRASVIADGAGANYGVMQANRHGSCLRILKLGNETKLADRYYKSKKMKIDSDIAQWFGSPSGIKAQCKYFDKFIWGLAKRIVTGLPSTHTWDHMGVMYQRLFLFAVDTVVQNGTLYSPNNKPFWRNLNGATSAKLKELYYGERWNKLLGMWIPYNELKSLWDSYGKNAKQGDERKDANKKVIRSLWEQAPSDRARLIMLAQYRARCSWSKYWTDVESRRMADVTGSGWVHGSYVNLARDFCIGIDMPDIEDRENPPESFHKETGSDILNILKLS